jgi:hypothetical protein
LLIWQDRLGYAQDFTTRLATAHDLLCQEHVQLDDRTRQFHDLPEGMHLVVEKASEICERGDKVAHQTPPTRKIYNGALNCFNNEGMRQLQILYVYRNYWQAAICNVSAVKYK